MTRSAAIILHDYEPSTNVFLDDVWAGLSQPAKRLPSKYFYDQQGCMLFDAICELDEYYVTRTELAIMRREALDISARIGPRAEIVEFGSGSSIKTRLLLDGLRQPTAYIPIDIARGHLAATAAQLRVRYPNLEVAPLCADFSEWFEPPECNGAAQRRVVYFPGSTLGNFEPDDADTLLARMAAMAGPGGGLLIGIDLHKDQRTLEAAYNDARGVTAQFNLNLLARINRELQGDFRLNQFEHVAIYNDTARRIEMHLISRRPQTVRVAGREFHFARGEAICTEYSYKYDRGEFRRQAHRAGFRHVQTWTDDRERFAVMYFETIG